MANAGRTKLAGLAYRIPAATIPGAPKSVAEVLDSPRRSQPEAVALVGRHARYTYAELDEVANRAGEALHRLGVAPGDRVAASLPNDPDIVVAFLGAMRLGAIWVGVNRGLAPPEKLALLADAEASVLLADHETLGALHARVDGSESWRSVEVGANDPSAPWQQLLAGASSQRPRREVDPFAPGAIAYTSGTTGQPKGVVHSQYNLVTVGAVNRLTGGWRAAPCQAAVLALTILNVMTLCPVAIFQLGGTCVVVDHHDPARLAAWVRDEQVASFSAVPTIVHDLVASPAVSPEDLASLSCIAAGGMALSDELRAAFRDRFGKELVTSYGLTEAPAMVTSQAPDESLPPGSSGKQRPHIEITIHDEHGRELPAGSVGAICVSPARQGPLAGVYTPFLGYWGQPAATRRVLDGTTLRTGDVGTLAEDGTLFVHGRADDVIIRGGVNVHPTEVVRVLETEPRIAAAAVVGRKDARLGEKIVAFVETTEGAAVTSEELRDYCRDRLTRSKIPDEFVVVEQFTRNTMGKIVMTSLPAAQQL